MVALENSTSTTKQHLISCDQVTKGKKGCFVVTKIGCFVELENKNETTHQLGEISCDQVKRLHTFGFVEQND